MYCSTFFVAILALARIAIATPPACLIAALGEQTNPSDIEALCGTLEPQVAGNITEKCSGAAEASAMSVFSSTCLASASVTVSMLQGSLDVQSKGYPAITSSQTYSHSFTTITGVNAKTTDTGMKTTPTSATAAPTGTNTNAAALTQPGLIVAPIVLAAGFVQYLI